MIVRPISLEERKTFDALVGHPLQSFAWGEFRSKTGVRVERIGVFDGPKMVNAFQVTFHPIPRFPYTVGYVPKSSMPDEMMLGALQQLGKKYNALFIKLEPNVSAPISSQSAHSQVAQFLLDHGCVLGKPLFTKYTFILDLNKTEDELLALMRPKTRYNIRIAQKHEVQIVEDSTLQGLGEYLNLMEETTKRQQFYAHSRSYFTSMWETLAPSNMIHLFKAMYQGKVLTAWIVFVFNNKLYYPYGASSREYRDVMANNLMMWEVIKFGKSQGCTSFDMWGSLGPNPDPKDPWFGFHRFKEGYGATLTQFVGTYDYVINPQLYSIFRFLDDARWKVLRLKAKFHI